MQIAFQANTGNLWTWTIGNPGYNTTLGMKAGTSPSLNPTLEVGGGHEIAFQADTGHFWTVGSAGQGDSGWNMRAGTSPSIDSGIAFQASSGHLWNGLSGEDSGLGMMAGTTPSYSLGDVAFQSDTGTLSYLYSGDTGVEMMPGTSPSLNDNSVNTHDHVAFQGRVDSSDPCGCRGSLFAGTLGGTNLHMGMMPGTSPSINDENDIAFQANTGDLYLTYDEGNGGGGDTGVKMMPCTSPSIDDQTTSWPREATVICGSGSPRQGEWHLTLTILVWG